jgi:hypothetical protein
MQGILNKPLGEATVRRYQVTGSWDKPKITQIAREKAGSAHREPQAATPKPPDAEHNPGAKASSEDPSADIPAPATDGLR